MKLLYVLFIAVVVWLQIGFVCITYFSLVQKFRSEGGIFGLNIRHHTTNYLCCYIGFYGQYRIHDDQPGTKRDYMAFFVLEENTGHCRTNTTPANIRRYRYSNVVEFFDGTESRCSTKYSIERLTNFTRTLEEPSSGVKVKKLRSQFKDRLQFNAEFDYDDPEHLLFDSSDLEFYAQKKKDLLIYRKYPRKLERIHPIKA